MATLTTIYIELICEIKPIKRTILEAVIDSLGVEDAVKDSTWEDLAILNDEGAFSEMAEVLRELGVRSNGYHKEKVNGG